MEAAGPSNSQARCRRYARRTYRGFPHSERKKHKENSTIDLVEGEGKDDADRSLEGLDCPVRPQTAANAKLLVHRIRLHIYCNFIFTASITSWPDVNPFVVRFSQVGELLEESVQSTSV